MNVYYRNEKAVLTGPDTAVGSSLLNVYDPMLELCAEFLEEEVTITGVYEEGAVAADALCLGFTNAYEYELETGENEFHGYFRDGALINIIDFDETLFISSFTLRLKVFEGLGNLYIGHLYLGARTVLPRFSVEPQVNTSLASVGTRSFGGQAFGMRRKTLESFAVNYKRITHDEYVVIKKYISDVLNIEPHIIDPYSEARRQFPPVYATLDVNEIPFTKLNEAGFFYAGSLSWKEAR